METKTKPFLLVKDENSPLLEQYTSNICNLFHVSNEQHDAIQYAVNESVNGLFNIEGMFSVHQIVIQYRKSEAGLWFELEGLRVKETEVYEEEQLDREIRRLNLERELFIVAKLSDKMFIDPERMKISIFFACEDIGFTRVMSRISNLQKYWSKEETIKI